MSVEITFDLDNHISKCRLCLKEFEIDDTQIKITKIVEIRVSYNFVIKNLLQLFKICPYFQFGELTSLMVSYFSFSSMSMVITYLNVAPLLAEKLGSILQCNL